MKSGFGKVLLVAALFLIAAFVVIGGIIVESQQQFIGTVVEKQSGNGSNYIVVQGGEILIADDDIAGSLSQGQTYLFTAIGINYEPLLLYRTVLTYKNMPYCDPSHPGAIICGIGNAQLAQVVGFQGNGSGNP